MRRTRYRRISDTVWTVLLWGLVLLQPIAFLGDVVNPDVDADTWRLLLAYFGWITLKRHRMDIALYEARGVDSEGLGKFILENHT